MGERLANVNERTIPCSLVAIYINDPEVTVSQGSTGGGMNWVCMRDIFKIRSYVGKCYTLRSEIFLGMHCFELSMHTSDFVNGPPLISVLSPSHS